MNYCMAKGTQRYNCTKEKGHHTEHVSSDETTGKVYERWPNETAAKEIVTPEIEAPFGMLDALAEQQLGHTYDEIPEKQRDIIRKAAETCCRYIANHPKQFSDEEHEEMRIAVAAGLGTTVSSAIYWQRWSDETQRRMFLKPSPAIPAGVKAILEDYKGSTEELLAKHGDSTKLVEEMAMKLYALGEMNGRAK